MKNVSDIKLKKNGLEESRGVLDAKLAEVNVKENALLGQLREIKDYLVNKIESKYKELEVEVTKTTREKRKVLEGRKSNLDRGTVAHACLTVSDSWAAKSGARPAKNNIQGAI